MKEEGHSKVVRLAVGMGGADDPYQIQELLLRPVEDLVEAVRKELRYSALSMVRSGRYFLAIKTKLGHGKWEDFALEQGWSYSYVNASMKLLEVAVRFPQAIHLPSGRVTDRILHLPMPKIESVLRELPPEAIKKLTPWDLEEIYKQKKSEGRPKRASKEKAPRRKEGKIDFSRLEDGAWVEAKGLFVAAAEALDRLEDALGKMALEDRHYNEIFSCKMHEALAERLDRIRKLWRPDPPAEADE